MSTSLIHLRYDDDRPAGTVERVSVPRGERIKEGFRAGRYFWLLAIPSAFIPLMHFILVPLFVVLGTVRAWSYWTTPGVLRNGAVECPRCHEKVVLENIPDAFPVKVLCEKCGYQLRLYEARGDERKD